jgi:hypothetical protein
LLVGGIEQPLGHNRAPTVAGALDRMYLRPNIARALLLAARTLAKI